MAHDTDTNTRIEAEPEAGSVVLSLYAHNLFQTIEMTAFDGRRLAADILKAADFLDHH